jgi:hypothetical protein
MAESRGVMKGYALDLHGRKHIVPQVQSNPSSSYLAHTEKKSWERSTLGWIPRYPSQRAA